MRSRMPVELGTGATVGEGAGRLWAFTLIEMLLTIAIIALLAALTVGGLRRVGGKGKETRIRAELNQLITAIESYKEDLGSYPGYDPARPQLNPLFYELTGVVVDNQAGVFRAPQDNQLISPELAKGLFGVEGFANAVTDPSQVRSYLKPKAQQHGTVTNLATGGIGDVLLVPVPWPRNAAEAQLPGPGFGGSIAAAPDMNPWHYVGPNHATNNQGGGFDLWAEYVDGNEVRVLGNWRADAFVDRPFIRK